MARFRMAEKANCRIDCSANQKKRSQTIDEWRHASDGLPYEYLTAEHPRIHKLHSDGGENDKDRSENDRRDQQYNSDVSDAFAEQEIDGADGKWRTAEQRARDVPCLEQHNLPAQQGD